MDVLTPDQLDRLIAASGEHLVSIYLPTERAGRETRQNPIRLKNLVAEAEERLDASGGDPALLDRLRDRIGDYDFWQHQADGLAILSGGGHHAELRLPARFDELVVVGDAFHVKPLLPVLDTGRTFFVLALSENDVRLLQGSRSTVAALDGDIPESMAAALWYEDPEPTLQHHATSRGGDQAARHGQGLGDDDAAERRRRFLRAVDDGVRSVTGSTGAPLVLAGDERVQAAYREAARYEPVLEEGIDGNPEGLSEAELHTRAWELISARFAAERTTAAERFRAAAGTGLTSVSPAEVALAAHDGRVDVLWVSSGEQLWGRFDPEAREAELSDQRRPGDRDLADAAAAAAYRTGARVLVVPADEMPAPASVAAIFRY